MLTTILLLASCVGQASQTSLSLDHMRVTHGFLGVPRERTGKVLPGDSVFLNFHIHGLAVDDQGKAHYQIELQVVDREGRVQFKQEGHEQETLDALGGDYFPAFAKVDIGLDQEPGTYQLKLRVSDRRAGAHLDLAHDFEVLPRAFGLVRLTASGDPQGLGPGALVIDGQPLWINCMAVGFDRDRTTHKAHVAVELQVLDDAGKPTMRQPMTGDIAQEVSGQESALPFQFLLPINRSGKFTVELKALDVVGNHRAALQFPLTVVELP